MPWDALLLDSKEEIGRGLAEISCAPRVTALYSTGAHPAGVISGLSTARFDAVFEDPAVGPKSRQPTPKVCGALEALSARSDGTRPGRPRWNGVGVAGRRRAATHPPTAARDFYLGTYNHERAGDDRRTCTPAQRAPHGAKRARGQELKRECHAAAATCSSGRRRRLGAGACRTEGFRPAPAAGRVGRLSAHEGRSRARRSEGDPL